MHTIRKEAAILAITQGDSLMLEVLPHDGQDVLSCPGTSKNGINELAPRVLGEVSASQLQPFGRIIDIIIKPNETVELVVDVYRVKIPEGTKIQLPKNHSWFSKKQLSEDPRGQRDARLYLRLLDDKPLDLQYSEDQRGKWIDAKILYWREMHQGT